MKFGRKMNEDVKGKKWTVRFDCSVRNRHEGGGKAQIELGSDDNGKFMISVKKQMTIL